MYHSTISWMMAGGLETETNEDLRYRRHQVAMRDAEAKPARGSMVDGLRARFAGLRPAVASSAPVLDCCAA